MKLAWVCAALALFALAAADETISIPGVVTPNVGGARHMLARCHAAR
jgi:hypothetical protein